MKSSLNKQCILTLTIVLNNNCDVHFTHVCVAHLEQLLQLYILFTREIMVHQTWMKRGTITDSTR